MHRSWAADREHLTKSLQGLAKDAKEVDTSRSQEGSSLLSQTRQKMRSPLWLLIFPEGTITSDEERAKSAKYAEREHVVSRRAPIRRASMWSSTAEIGY
jgi:1-acyl-sn-glycerol-3-phosphate acyltransferase